MLWSYINNIAADHPFFDDTYIMNAGLTPKIIKNLNKDIEKDSNFYKHWFKNLNETTNYIEYFMKYWINDNMAEVSKFCNILEKSCNRILESLGDNS